MLVVSAHRWPGGTIPIALVILLLGYATDVLDGWLARRWSLQSVHGRNVDVFCDRVLHLGGFLVVATCGGPALGVIALAARDLIVTTIRIVTRPRRERLHAERCLSLVHAFTVRVWLALFILSGATGPDASLVHSLMCLALVTGYSSVLLTAVVAHRRTTS